MNGERDIKYEVGKGLQSEAVERENWGFFALET